MTTRRIKVPACILDLPFHHSAHSRQYLRAAHVVEYLRNERKLLADVPESVTLEAVIDPVDAEAFDYVFYCNPPKELCGFKLVTEKPVSSVTITQEEKSTVVEIESDAPTRTIFSPQEKPLDIRTKPPADDTCVPGRVTIVVPPPPSLASITNRHTEIVAHLKREAQALVSRGLKRGDNWTAVVTHSDYVYLEAYYSNGLTTSIPDILGFKIVEGKEPAGVKVGATSHREAVGDSRVPHRSEGRDLKCDQMGLVSIVVPETPEDSLLTRAAYVRNYLKARGASLVLAGLEHAKRQAWLAPADFAAAKEEWGCNKGGLFLSGFKLHSLYEAQTQTFGVDVTKEGVNVCIRKEDIGGQVAKHLSRAFSEEPVNQSETFRDYLIRQLKSLNGRGASRVEKELDFLIRREQLTDRLLPLIHQMDFDRVPLDDRTLTVSPAEFVVAQRFGQVHSSKRVMFLGVWVKKAK